VGTLRFVRQFGFVGTTLVLLLQPGANARVAAGSPPQSAAVSSAAPRATNVTRDAQRRSGAGVGDARVVIETPAASATLPSSFAVEGWAIDPDAATGSGVDAIEIYAYPNFGSGQPAYALGAAQYGLSRPDVGAAFGSRFTPSGFHLDAAGLLTGQYRIIVFAHTVSTNSFSAYMFADVSIAPLRALTIDAPADSAVVNQGFMMTGWALDTGATSGTGIDAIHVYVSSNDGADPLAFLGVATLGFARTDIGATYGKSFTPSGYAFTVNGLDAGPYVLYAFAHSTVTNSFCLVATRHITVQATTFMSIDVPAAGSTAASRTFWVAGWAIDRAASSGTGIDALHIYAYPDPGSGRAPIFLGVATVGYSREDIAAAFGAQFSTAGYGLFVNADASGLAAGTYQIVVWAHSSAANAFTRSASVQVRLP
jgi:hypothetical protein